jgi:hypothetical protein
MAKGIVTLGDLENWKEKCRTWTEELNSLHADLSHSPNAQGVVEINSRESWDRIEEDMTRILLNVSAGIAKAKYQKKDVPAEAATKSPETPKPKRKRTTS